MFAALDAGRECRDRGGVLEEMAQGAGRAGGYDAAGDDAAGVRVGGGEEFSVWLEGCEEAVGLLRNQFWGSDS